MALALVWLPDLGQAVFKHVKYPAFGFAARVDPSIDFQIVIALEHLDSAIQPTGDIAAFRVFIIITESFEVLFHAAYVFGPVGQSIATGLAIKSENLLKKLIGASFLLIVS